jgi:16S rRNA (guanine966-N2)-methyltransferase
MRVVGGTLRGKKLIAPDDNAIRPTSDRVRESLYNILANKSWAGTQPLPMGAKVIDVFAGTGALGIEALSRGATEVAFIEQDRAALKLIEQNLKGLKHDGNARILTRNALMPGRAIFQADLVLMDPPYKQDLATNCLTALAENNWLAPGAICVVETQKNEILEIPTDFNEIDCRTYGNSQLIVLLTSE